MTKNKLRDLSKKEQSDRFKEAVQKLIAAGELDPIEASTRMEEFFQTRNAKKVNRSL